MFTGLIKILGTVETLAARTDGGAVLRVNAPLGSAPELGESIAVNGVCLTVAESLTKSSSNWELVFFLSAETLTRSTLARLQTGERVHLERALLASERLGGHFVQGHVDGVGFVERITPHGESHGLTVRLPEDLSKFCVEKGSISLDGVSLTLNAVVGNHVSIELIPHTWKNTRFSALKPGSPLNIEVDILAKYVVKLTEKSCPTSPAR